MEGINGNQDTVSSTRRVRIKGTKRRTLIFIALEVRPKQDTVQADLGNDVSSALRDVLGHTDTYTVNTPMGLSGRNKEVSSKRNIGVSSVVQVLIRMDVHDKNAVDVR